MSNVLSFPQSNIHARPPETALACALAASTDGPITEVKEELIRAILSLDLAYLQTWRLVRKLHHPASRERLSTQLSAIESLLNIAREKVRNI